MDLFSWKEAVYFAVIAFSILLPELYLTMHWPLRTLMSVRMVTLLVTCVLATLVGVWADPTVTAATEFTRVFIYIGVCRMIMLSSHEYAADRKRTRRQEVIPYDDHPDTHERNR